MVSGLVQVGLNADTAIDQIYAVYGQQTSVTNIINGIKRDSKAGTLNPNLRHNKSVFRTNSADGCQYKIESLTPRAALHISTWNQC